MVYKVWGDFAVQCSIQEAIDTLRAQAMIGDAIKLGILSKRVTIEASTVPECIYDILASLSPSDTIKTQEFGDLNVYGSLLTDVIRTVQRRMGLATAVFHDLARHRPEVAHSLAYALHHGRLVLEVVYPETLSTNVTTHYNADQILIAKGALTVYTPHLTRFSL